MAIIAGKKQAFIKFFIIFAAYLCYTSIFSMLFSCLGITGVIVSFVSDLLFFAGIIYVYKDSLKDDFNALKKFKISTIVKIILGGTAGIFLINIFGGVITEILFPGQDMTDENTDAIYLLGNTSLIYMIFKTTLFSAIAEELVYRKTVRNVIDDKWLFIFLSSLIYALMNIAYSDFNVISIVDLIQCFIFGAFVSAIYVRCNNIIVIMLMKLVYTLIPLTIMLSGLGG